jgi:hypothetical protein
MNPLVASVIRTIVPAAVGQVAAWLTLLNVPLTPEAETGLTAFLGFAFTAIYYLVVRIIEQQWPSFGVFLGLPKSPDTYSKSVDTAAVPPAPTTGADAGLGPWQGDGHGAAPEVIAPEVAVPDGTHSI